MFVDLNDQADAQRSCNQLTRSKASSKAFEVFELESTTKTPNRTNNDENTNQIGNQQRREHKSKPVQESNLIVRTDRKSVV